MHGEVGGRGEALVALGAREQLLARVLGHVDAQLRAVGAALGAHRTGKSENKSGTFVNNIFYRCFGGSIRIGRMMGLENLAKQRKCEKQWNGKRVNWKTEFWKKRSEKRKKR